MMSCTDGKTRSAPADRRLNVDGDDNVHGDDVDPVVIISTACRLPGGISSPQGLWDVLLGDRDVLGPFPDDRGW
ncbi:MAG: polyene macrolide polyketide synthase, loading module, partial [Actinomycetota bacterium]|nr:polyene macrolide polyketide synthase, loading module [Actinomycetota bacterium]